MTNPTLPEWLPYVWIVLVALYLAYPVYWLLGWARVLRQDLARRRERG